MPLAIREMHDATLVSIRFDWASQVCVLEFSGAPGFTAPFEVAFSNVSQLVIPAMSTWGPSSSVLQVSDTGGGHFEFAMQSGDTISVVAPNNSFKPKPLRGSA